MNWKQEMGWKSEPTRVIQAQPSWKVRLLSGSYCSHEIRRGEGSQMLPRSCFIVRKTLLTMEQDFPLQLQMDGRGFKMQPVVWNWLQTFLVFIKHCPQLQLGLAVIALRAVLWASTDRSEGRGSTTPEVPGFPKFPVKSDFFGTGIPAAICSRLGLRAVLWGSELSRSHVLLGFSCAVQTRLFSAFETSARLLMGCKEDWVFLPAQSWLGFCAAAWVSLENSKWSTGFHSSQNDTVEVAGKVFQGVGAVG